MTIMRLTLAGVELDAERKEQLAKRLIDCFARIEVGQSSPAIRAGFVVHIEQVSPDGLWMGDRRMTDASPVGRAALLDTRVMAGPWNDEMKAQLFEGLEAVVREGVGMPAEGNGADFWMTIVEVPEGAWGLGSHAVSIAKLAPVFSEDRRARIRAHLAARGDPGE